MYCQPPKFSMEEGVVIKVRISCFDFPQQSIQIGRWYKGFPSALILPKESFCHNPFPELSNISRPTHLLWVYSISPPRLSNYTDPGPITQPGPRGLSHRMQVTAKTLVRMHPYGLGDVDAFWAHMMIPLHRPLLKCHKLFRSGPISPYQVHGLILSASKGAAKSMVGTNPMSLGMQTPSEITWMAHDDHTTHALCHLVSQPLSWWPGLEGPNPLFFNLFYLITC